MKREILYKKKKGGNGDEVSSGEQGKVSREVILERTHYGVRVYAHVLRQYYQDDVVLLLSGKSCKPAKSPFNGDRQTLHVSIVDGVARHYDAEVEGCKGDAFDFAALHYKVEGMELLERLNEEMSLGIGKDVQYCNSAEGVERDKKVEREGGDVHEGHGANGADDANVADEEQAGKGSETDLPQFCQFRQFRQFRQIDKSGGIVFSFFKKPVRNTLPSGSISLLEVYKKIKGTTYRKQTNALRAIHNEKEARAFKAEQFDYVTFSGTFTKRVNSALVQHSGLFAVDLDHLDNVEGLRQRLLKDPYFETLLLFVSPSGRGLKWIIPIDLNKATHQQYAVAISNYLLHHYGQKMDASGKDVARACFLPHDPNIYINPNLTPGPSPRSGEGCLS